MCIDITMMGQIQAHHHSCVTGNVSHIPRYMTLTLNGDQKPWYNSSLVKVLMSLDEPMTFNFYQISKILRHDLDLKPYLVHSKAHC